MTDDAASKAFRLDGEVALITGGGSGLGLGMARCMARAGAAVVILGRREATLREACVEIGEAATYEVADITEFATVGAVVERIAARVGPVSILVNNAGIMPPHTVDSPDLEHAWEATMDVNLKGTLNITLALLPALRATRGSIVNISSLGAFIAPGLPLAYCASKAGIKMMTQSLAGQLGKDGVRVNAIAPGMIKTELSRASRENPERMAFLMARIPLKRIGEPEDLVGPVVFLASEMSSYVTGATIVLDGGLLAV
jgi:NAD(P)-dependent dehydrogenase (short-subunit alcohol dehydrogenase family)